MSPTSLLAYFESAVEAANPPTITQLAYIGRKRRVLPNMETAAAKQIEVVLQHPKKGGFLGALKGDKAAAGGRVERRILSPVRAREAQG
jgi:hypothetical protein